MDSKRQTGVRGPTRSLQPQSHQDTEEIHEPLVFSVPPRLRGSSASKGAEGDRAGTTALADPAKTMSRRVHRPAEPQEATRGSREETKNAEKRPGVLHRETDLRYLHSFRLFSCFFGCGLGSREYLAVGDDAAGKQCKEANDHTRRCAAALSPSLRLLPGLRVLRSQPPRWESSGSKRDHSLNTLVPAALGSRRNGSAGAEIRRILYGKVPAVRLRTWPHFAADDDHPTGNDECSLRQRRRQGTATATCSGQPRRAGIVVEGAAGKARER